MIQEALNFLKTRLTTYLDIECPVNPEPPERVGFIGLSSSQPTFDQGKTHIILINTDEEKIARPADPYIQINNNGATAQVKPPIRLNLYVLFAVLCNEYDDALKHLSYVIQFFQIYPVFSKSDFTDLPDTVDRLTMELNSMTTTQQNEIWGMLKTAHLPSVLYKMRLVAFQQEFPAETDKQITQVDILP